MLFLNLPKLETKYCLSSISTFSKITSFHISFSKSLFLFSYSHLNLYAIFDNPFTQFPIAFLPLWTVLVYPLLKAHVPANSIELYFSITSFVCGLILRTSLFLLQSILTPSHLCILFSLRVNHSKFIKLLFSLFLSL